MAIVRLAGSVLGEEDPNRPTRAKLLYLLFDGGWDIYNSNGDQRITLSNIQKKIAESDAFVFTPGATLEDLFKLTSIFVGYQTLDRQLAGKATVILNSDGSWDAYFALLRHLQRLGTIRQEFSDYLLEVRSPKDVLTKLRAAGRRGKVAIADPGRHTATTGKVESFESEPGSEADTNVCVFCSATIEDPAYMRDGYALGKMLAEGGHGCVSGAGSSGIMGAVVRGAAENGGWTGGSNVPHIIELEGLPDGLSAFWPRPDIYTRMEVMIERSEAFVAFPGGAGTVQETLALLILKQQGSQLMRGKPVVVFNRKDADGVSFWNPFLALLDHLGLGELLVAVDSLDAIIPTIESARAAADPGVAEGRSVA
ncbi:hypothetical protein BH23VER1_BH23VER1_09780 [soil metagenome]